MARILVVEDDRSTQMMMQMGLTAAGHTVILASNGWEAIGVAKKNLPDIILMDLMMPLFDGRSAAYALRQIPSTAAIPIVAVSARLGLGTAMRHFDACLAKPCSIKAMLAQIDQLLGSQQPRSPDQEPAAA